MSADWLRGHVEKTRLMVHVWTSDFVCIIAIWFLHCAQTLRNSSTLDVCLCVSSLSIKDTVTSALPILQLFSLQEPRTFLRDSTLDPFLQEEPGLVLHPGPWFLLQCRSFYKNESYLGAAWRTEHGCMANLLSQYCKNIHLALLYLLKLSMKMVVWLDWPCRRFLQYICFYASGTASMLVPSWFPIWFLPKLLKAHCCIA